MRLEILMLMVAMLSGGLACDVRVDDFGMLSPSSMMPRHSEPSDLPSGPGIKCCHCSGSGGCGQGGSETPVFPSSSPLPPPQGQQGAGAPAASAAAALNDFNPRTA